MGCPVMYSSSPIPLRVLPLSLHPARSPPPAHLLLKSFSRYLLKWAKLAIQSAARGAGVSGSCSSSPRAPRGGASSSTRHTRASAHAQRRAGAWGGGGEADGAAGCHVTPTADPGLDGLSEASTCGTHAGARGRTGHPGSQA